MKPVKSFNSLISQFNPLTVISLSSSLTCFYHRVQSAQQFQALQAQYSGVNPHLQFPHPEGHGAMAHMAHPEATMDQQEPANLAKGTESLRGKHPDSPSAHNENLLMIFIMSAGCSV